jgi:hypothetical protein
MYIQNIRHHAFDDFSFEDLDPSFIQGQILILVCNVTIEFSFELLFAWTFVMVSVDGTSIICQLIVGILAIFKCHNQINPRWPR